MGMTISQKILAAHAKKDKVTAGEFIVADLDVTLANDVTAPVAVNEYEKYCGCKVCDPSKIALVMDHFTPNKDIKAAEQVKTVRNFAKAQGVQNYFEGGEAGVEHVLLPEKGLVAAGDLIIGADSHTCTYGALGAFATGVGSTDLAAGMAYGKGWFKVPAAMKFILKGKPGKYVNGKDVILKIIGDIGVDGALYKSMEYTGDGVKNLTIDDRFTICNMAIEAGAKNGIFVADAVAEAYLKERGARPSKKYEADPDAEYDAAVEIDMSALEPLVAFPHLPSNVKTVRESGHITLDQVVIGSCTNGRFSDFDAAAAILKGKKVQKGLRVLIIPATQKIYMELLKCGHLETFAEAGCIISPPTCGPCLGGHMGILAKGERALATTNRNFVGRMGHPESEVYLSNAAVAAASALTGRITHPDEVL